ncbi:ionotropic receptor 75a-like [Bombus bifarius]|uniref:Ionotropic receptor 75a-like n=1 Tax=Bombus bifarius TaxID=103933 RepID=A0A6P8N2S2_9HYME|nr:ionotropic receptor 75a-like [Bombus bifarius]
MYTVLFVLLQFVLISNAQDHVFIRDYFVYKKVRNVVGFSCGDIVERNVNVKILSLEKMIVRRNVVSRQIHITVRYIGDFNLLKTLSTTGIFTIIREPSVKIDFRRFMRSETWTVGVVIDLRCRNETAVRIFAESSKYRMYDYSYNWLVLGSDYNNSIPFLNDTAYNIVTDVVLAITNKNGYDLYDVFNHCKYRGGALNITELGTWHRESGLKVFLTQPLISRRANMHGMRLKISGVIQYRPKNMRLEDYMQDINTRSLDSMHKFVHAMILHTGDLFNFSVHASEIIYWDRHSVHGLIFEFLRSNYIDFASNPRIMVSERLDYATLIGAAWPIRPCFMLLSTSTNKIKLEIFLKPFTRQTWYVFAVFGLFSVFVMKMIMNREDIGKREKYSGAVVLSIGIVSQQGANFLPKRLPSRIALFQIIIHSWIMYNYYSASIVSARLSEPLDMMEDSVTVLADSNLKIAAEAVPYLNYFLYKLNWESDYFRKKRWDPLPESKRYLPIEEGIRQVGQGILAYHTDPNTAYPYVERMFDSNKICELTEIHLFKQSVMGMYASHNGQFIEIAKIGLTKMFNTGLRNRQIKHWSSRKPQCQPDTLSTRSITIYETAPALILLAFGMLVAGIICIVENIIYNHTMKSMEKSARKRSEAKGSFSSSNSGRNLLDINP